MRVFGPHARTCRDQGQTAYQRGRITFTLSPVCHAHARRAGGGFLGQPAGGNMFLAANPQQQQQQQQQQQAASAEADEKAQKRAEALDRKTRLKEFTIMQRFVEQEKPDKPVEVATNRVENYIRKVRLRACCLVCCLLCCLLA